MKPSFRLLVLTVLRRLLARSVEEGDDELARQLDDAIEEEQPQKQESAEGDEP